MWVRYVRNQCPFAEVKLANTPRQASALRVSRAEPAPQFYCNRMSVTQSFLCISCASRVQDFRLIKEFAIIK